MGDNCVTPGRDGMVRVLTLYVPREGNAQSQAQGRLSSPCLPDVQKTGVLLEQNTVLSSQSSLGRHEGCVFALPLPSRLVYCPPEVLEVPTSPAPHFAEGTAPPHSH